MADGDTVQVRNALTGYVEEVSPAEARLRIHSGDRIASSDEARLDSLDREFGGAGHQALAFGAGLARGATFGLSDVALAELGGEEYRSALQAYRELHPGTSTAGELVGALAVPLPGAGEAGLGASILREAAIGGAMGLGTGLSEAALSGEKYNGEALAASMGIGALIGGGIGGAFAGKSALAARRAERLQSSMVRPGEEAVASLIERGLGQKVAEGSGDMIGKAWAAGAKLTGVRGASELEELGAMNATGREARRLIQNETEEIATATKVIQTEGKKLEEGLQVLHEITGAAKQEQWAAKVATERPAEVLAAARTEGQRVADRLAEMQTAGEGAFAKADKLRKLSQRTRDAVAKLRGTADPAEAAFLLDELKRDTGSYARQVGQKAKTSNQRATASALKEIYGDLQNVLENPLLWGEEAATMQREVNKGWTNLLDQKRTDPRLQRFLEFREGGFAEGGNYIFSHVNAERILKNAADPSNAEAIAAYKGHIGQAVPLAESALKNMVLSDAERAALQSVVESAPKMTQAFEHAENVARKVEQFNKIQGGGNGMLGYAVAAGLGAAGSEDGDLGAMAPLAIAAGIFGNPARAVRQLAGLESLIGRSVRTAEKAGARVTKRSDLLQRVATWSAIETGERAKLIRGVDTVKATPPDMAAEQARQHLGNIAAVAPKVVESAAEVAHRAAAYLQAHAPQPVMRPGVIMSLGLPPSDYELEIFERRRKVVNAPLSILDDLHSGMITPEAVDALKNVYPGLHMKIRQSLLLDLGRLAGEGQSLPYDRIMNIEALLGQPVEGINAPEVLEAIQKSYMPTPEPPAEPSLGRPGPDVAKFFDQENDPVLREVG